MEQHPELLQLRTEAERLIADGRWLLRMTTHVALGGLGAVGIMSIRGGEVVVVRFWDFKADYARLRSPVEPSAPPRKLTPTIHEQQFATNPERSKSLIAQLALLQVPVLPEPNTVTIDGVLYDIFCQRGQHSTTMRWVSTAPKGWETLAVWFQAAWAGLSKDIGGTPDPSDLS